MTTKATLAAVLIFTVSSSFAVAEEKAKNKRELKGPTTIAPVFAYAKVRSADDRSLNKMGALFEVVVSSPEVRWKVENKKIREGKVAIWKEFGTNIKTHELVLDFDSASQVPESTIVRLNGTKLSHDEIKAEFKSSKTVLLSLDGKGMDPFYKDFFAPDTLVIILARDEGMGNLQLLAKPMNN